jgi:glycosyltransferase involved in cell wall biosynthesis
MISIIVPAYNEAHELPGALASIFQAARAAGRPFEVIVVNDASTDHTRDLALKAGARVIDVQLRKISAVRNAGAKQAAGDRFFFVDADTRISETLLRAALTALDEGAVGGGAWVGFESSINFFVDTGIHIFNFFYLGLMGWAAGCFIFARRDAFEAVGGFDERLYATEEITLSRALKRQGRFVVLREAVITSSRKLRMYSAWEMVPLTFRLLRHGPGIFRQPKGLEWWYEGKREKQKHT